MRVCGEMTRLEADLESGMEEFTLNTQRSVLSLVELIKLWLKCNYFWRNYEM